MTEQHDVVVVGAGLSGLRMARLLAESGLSVLLADRKTDLGRGVHTTGIFVRRTLASFRLPPECLGPAVRHVTLYSPARRPLKLESPRDEFRIGRMAPLYEYELRRARQAGAEWAPGCRFEGLEFLRTSTLVKLTDPEGAHRLLRTRFVVGADGTFSTAARHLELDRNRDWIVGVEEVFRGIDVQGPPRLHVMLDPQLAPGYIAWAAHDGHELHVGTGGHPSRFDPDRALRGVRELAGELLAGEGLIASRHALTRASSPERRAGAIPVGGILERLASTRGLLVGDAAGAPSPLTAGGLDPCLRLTATAAEVIVDHLTPGGAPTLAEYRGGNFRPRFVSRLAMRKLYDSLDDPRLIEAMCLALRVLPLRLAARHLFFGDGSFPDPSAELPLGIGVTTSRSRGAIMRT
ncbi:MAG: NAD(P)/FAD-dependent oxidoreductase [Actinobacteria bacterium]|nr:NAD(P)/FAD-dependent oxidoreductase [Actinomycetota bacterium]